MSGAGSARRSLVCVLHDSATTRLGRVWAKKLALLPVARAELLKLRGVSPELGRQDTCCGKPCVVGQERGDRGSGTEWKLFP